MRAILAALPRPLQAMTIKQAITKAGSRRLLAEMLGITTQATYQWRRVVPPARVDQSKQLRPEWFAGV